MRAAIFVMATRKQVRLNLWGPGLLNHEGGSGLLVWREMISLGQTTVNLNFPPTQVIRVDGQLYDYRGRARDKQRGCFEADNRLRVDFSDREILSLQHERKLEILGHAEAEFRSTGRRRTETTDETSTSLRPKIWARLNGF